AFDLDKVQKHGAMWDRQKLLDVNQRWLRRLPDDEFIAEGGLDAPDPERLKKAVPLLKERAHTFGDARALLDGELSCLFAKPELNAAQLVAKETVPGSTKQHLEAFDGLIAALHEEATPADAEAALKPYADAIPKEAGGRGAALWPLRYALSGLERSPD